MIFAVIPASNSTISNGTNIIANVTIVVPEKNQEKISVEVYVAAIAASAAAGGLIYNGFSYRKSLKVQEMQLLKNFSDELSNLELSKERDRDYPVFAVQYLNVLDRISYLTLKKLIPKHIPVYFKDNFSAGLGILEKSEFKKYEESMGYLIQWCNQNNIEATKAP